VQKPPRSAAFREQRRLQRPGLPEVPAPGLPAAPVGARWACTGGPWCVLERVASTPGAPGARTPVLGPGALRGPPEGGVGVAEGCAAGKIGVRVAEQAVAKREGGAGEGSAEIFLAELVPPAPNSPGVEQARPNTGGEGPGARRCLLGMAAAVRGQAHPSAGPAPRAAARASQAGESQFVRCWAGSLP
jgi:hypothetical protein